MKKYINYLVFFTFAGLIIFQTGINNVYSTDPPTKVAEYLNLLKSDNVYKQIEAAKNITNSALSDPELFDFINQKLLNEYQSFPNSAKHVDLMAWLCKALASSGNLKYKETFEKIAETATSEKIQRYAIQSTALVGEYAKRNEIITAGTDTSPNPEITKLTNMLKSSDTVLKKNAAKIITRSNFTSPQLFDVVNEELLNGYALNTSDREHVDVMAWLCKALSASGMKKYKNSLKEVLDNTHNDKLRKYALKSYNALVAKTGN